MDSENLTYKRYLSPPPFEGGSGWVLSFILKKPPQSYKKKSIFANLFFYFDQNLQNLFKCVSF